MYLQLFSDSRLLSTSTIFNQKKRRRERGKEKKRKMPLTPQARSAYRALLREHPRRNLLQSSPTSTSTTSTSTSTTPLHNHLRELFRNGVPTATGTAPATDPKAEKTNQEEESEVERQRGIQRIQEAQQVAQYAKAQRTYTSLLELYYPGMSMDEEERVRLTARRVGLDLPVVPGQEGQ